MDANTLEDIATVVIDANTLEEAVLFLESETESDLGVHIALPNPDSCDISVMMFRDHVPSKGRKRKTRGTTSKQKETSVTLNSNVNPIPSSVVSEIRKRGRPAGSKNVPKNTSAEVPVVPAPKKRGRPKGSKIKPKKLS